MGIVVATAMFLGLIAFWRSKQDSFNKVATYCLFIFGGWNTLWYGVQNWSQFWGVAALVSGLVMLSAAAILQRPTDRSLKTIVLVGLMASFLLYAVTLIQLNLGLPIIR
ncbi:MAG: hypothetical protein AAF197_07525 [Pseudomonadota bacterium]